MYVYYMYISDALVWFVPLRFRRALSNNKLRRLPDSAAGAAPQLQRWGAAPPGPPVAGRRPESASGAIYKLSKSSTFRNEVLASRKNGVIHKFNLDGIIQKSTFQMINERTGRSRLVGDFIERSQHSSHRQQQQRILLHHQQQQPQGVEGEGDGEGEEGGWWDREQPLSPFDRAAPPQDLLQEGEGEGEGQEEQPRRLAGKGASLAMLSLAAEQLWVRTLHCCDRTHLPNDEWF